MSTLIIDKYADFKDTKIAIIATIGRSVYNPIKNINHIEDLLNAGVTAFRINFSHVTQERTPDSTSYQEVHDIIHYIRDLEETKHIPIPVIMDLKGPEIRTDCLMCNEKELVNLSVDKDNTIYIFQKNHVNHLEKINNIVGNNSESKIIIIRYEGTFFDEVHEKHRIRIDDGRIELITEVKNEPDEYVICRVKTKGIIKLDKSVNLPDRENPSIDYLIRKDIIDIEQTFDVDFVAQSFVTSKIDIDRLAQKLHDHYVIKNDKFREPFIIAKIETKDAVTKNTFLEILEHNKTFGVMIGRGDLGGETEIADVPGIQKKLITDLL